MTKSNELSYYMKDYWIMSKFKVMLTNLLKVCFALQNQSQSKVHYLYILAFFNTLKDYSPFAVKPDAKFVRYWKCQTVEEAINLADALFDEEKHLEVYELLNRLKYNKHPEVLWRICRSLYHLSRKTDISEDMKKQMIEEAYSILAAALPTGDDSADYHKWLAIILDIKNGFQSVETRVKFYPQVIKHLKKSCQLNPNDATVHYMLGRWHFEMSRLTRFQRFLSRVLIWEAPQSSYEAAYKSLSSAEELAPRAFLPNMYLLGKTCLNLGQYYRAKYYLNLVVNMTPEDEREKKYIADAKKLLKKLKKYDLGKKALFFDNPFGFSD